MLSEVVTLEKCNEKQLIFLQDEQIIEADFFNIIFHDPAARVHACEMIENADKIKIEKDKLIQEENYYIFLDGKLLQEILIQEDMAEIMIDYPDYKYISQMQKKEITAVMSEPVRMINTNRSWIILISLVTICIFLLLILAQL